MSERQGRRIVALVLTHNAPQSLARCLTAIGAQAELPDEILVVDNASQPPVDVSSAREFRSLVASHPVGSERRTGGRMGDRVQGILGQRLHPRLGDG